MQESVSSDSHTDPKTKDRPGEIFRISHTVDTGYRRDDNDITPSRHQ